uniref:Uncharacterized protein n=1 Tax=Macrostomum lignano TaxID=282301 RepID=A0A1I8F9B3_9PLAT
MFSRRGSRSAHRRRQNFLGPAGGRQRDLILEPASQLTVRSAISWRQATKPTIDCAASRCTSWNAWQESGLYCLTKICCKALGALAHCLASPADIVHERLAKVFNEAAAGSASLERWRPRLAEILPIGPNAVCSASRFSRTCGVTKP